MAKKVLCNRYNCVGKIEKKSSVNTFPDLRKVSINFSRYT